MKRKSPEFQMGFVKASLLRKKQSQAATSTAATSARTANPWRPVEDVVLFASEVVSLRLDI